MYDYAILMMAGVKQMKGTTIVELNAKRGVGIKHIIEDYKPSRAYAIEAN